jgi:Rps23 Pro-64 3,4-dihydroxylase Tpa1-like proline 4-hydroxylase
MWQLGHRDPDGAANSSRREEALAAAWRAALPFPYIILDDVVPTGDLMEVLDDEGVARYEADLFVFEASPPNGLAELRVRFAEVFAPLLSRVTGKQVTRADMRAFAYRPGHYLLPHTDHQDGLERLLAYAYYLPSPEPPRGGELELYRCERELTVIESATLIEPKPWRLVVFDVSDVSLHQVREVLGGLRISLAGWFYA